ncbi:penicillin-binding protein 1C [Campylobacter ureolyticus]|uniref:penicillin-binding protein 1C n=1 Tax=Campylobacter ureolyticus TaxID=827 RepID=UPI0022B54D65|nr:penicillin-binding protein 1C [Campylobacter ureolyticus]MCZ6172957.1 penicillin-binding protein 1C [Campylobacter ureolyticus]
MKKFIVALLLIIIFPSFLFFILNLAFPLDKTELFLKESYILYDKNGKIVSQRVNDDGLWFYKTDEIPPIFKKSIINFEDKYFYYHFGVNPFSIIRAFFHNLTNPNKIGASTITMQVARMIEPKKRSYKNKIIEIFRAFQIELNYTKDEILTLYFNLAPYGGNITGIKAASYFYFNKNLDELSLSQMALLTTVPKNPNQNRLDKNKNLTTLKNRVLKALLKDKIINENSYKRALKESFSPKRFSAKNSAFHYCNLAFKNNLKNSNLDLNLQNFIEQRTKNLVLNLQNHNINNASVVVIDNALMEVVAYVGSHDLKAQNGFNDGVLAKRNVGSTLKPFIYALSFDSGLITPKQRLIDSEIYINEYKPTNFYEDYLGVIPADLALNFSINTISVYLNDKLKSNSLYELLLKANLVKNKKNFYGSSIALGGISLSLLDLTHLYTSFANGGELKPLKFAGFLIDKNEKLFSKQSAFLVSEILSNSPRSYLNSVWQNTLDMPKIAFKTGTSANGVDLLVVGYDKNYTIGIWLGNFSGLPTKNMSAAQSSAKLLFEIYSFLNKREKLEFLKEPSGIIKEKRCVDEFKFQECKNYKDDFLIENVVIKDICQLLTNEQLNHLLINKIIDEKEILNSPCKELFTNKPPLIATPYNNAVIMGDISKISVKCMSFLGKSVFIKVDDEDYKKVDSASDNFVELKSGKHTIYCLDENSNLSTSNIEIKGF